MTKDRSVKAEIERLIAEIERKVAEWRARASVLRPKRYTGSDDAANATEQCADELESLLSALIAESPQDQKEQGDTRVDHSQYPKPLATASENKLGPTAEADYLRGYAAALIDAIAALTRARDAGGDDDAAHDGLNAAVFAIRQIRPPEIVR
jgi:hypothetical protein